MNKLKLLFLGCLFSVTAYGQQPGRIYLDSLLQTTARNYPLIKAKRLQTRGLEEAVQLRRNGFIPSLNVSYQVDYATYNNITGMIYPQFIVPISGPPSQTNNYSGIPGSAAALTLFWEPFTFGQRGTEIDLAKSRAEAGRADEALTVYRQQLLVINAWLNYQLTADLVKVYQIAIDRQGYDLKRAQGLVSSGLRPGTDSSSFHAELAKAKVRLLAFEQRRDSTMIILKELTGGQLPPNLVTDTTIFQYLPIATAISSAVLHPEIGLKQQQVQTDELTLKASRRGLLPKLTFWGTTYGRGSGVDASGTVNSNNGLGFERYNYGIGAQLSFPILEFIRQKPLFRQQEFNIAVSREQLAETQLQLNTQQEVAESSLQKSISAARLTPEASRAAKYAYEAILSRYQSGLISYADVILSQQQLYEAEATVKVAYWTAWKALLNKAAGAGSLDVFLNQYGK